MAEDENTPSDAGSEQPEQQTEEKPKSKKAEKKAVKKETAKPAKKSKPKHKALPEPKAPKRASGNGISNSAILIAVYVILGLLVVATSFYTGYLIGKSSGGDVTGKLSAAVSQGVLTQAEYNAAVSAIEKAAAVKPTPMTGTLQIIEYSDFQCPFCTRVAPTVKQIQQAYGDKVEVIYKHFPLESIHPQAMGAAIASECARNQDKFWEYHDVLFANQNALNDADLKKYAADLGLNTGKFNTCLDNKETAARVQADIQEAQGRGVQGTPSFWIKDELFVGAQPFESFKAKIDEKLSGKAAPAPAPAPSVPDAPSAPVDVAMGTHIKGDADAPVTIVEFSDFQCPFCQRHVQQTESQIVDTYVKTGKVKIAFRHFPLSFHQNAQKAAEASECAAKQGKFWEMHDMLFAKGSGDGTGLDVASLKTYAADLKLDTAKFNSCLDSGETASIVQKDFADGQAAGVSGTPAFFINGKSLVGAQPFTSFKAAIDAELG